MRFNDYREVIAWIHGTLRLGIKPGLNRMQFLLKRLDHPETKNQWIHVAGTNGKGSTVTFIRGILESSGYQVGTFTSPYIETFNERICINGVPISNQDLVKVGNIIYPITLEMKDSEFGEPSEFEIITAMMFIYFSKIKPIDIGVIEVGLGGRLDSTNVLIPLISVITTIGMDHMAFLGNTLQAIATEKAGIIKDSVPVVSGVIQPEAAQAIKKIADQKRAPLTIIKEDFDLVKNCEKGLTFKNSQIEITTINLGLKGLHQYHNAALALQTVFLLEERAHFEITELAIKRGLSEAFWPGRMEQVTKEPICILDGAHNPEGMQAFAENAASYDAKKIILCSILGDKDYAQMLNILKNINNTQVFLTTFDYPRALRQDQLLEVAKENDVQAVINWQNWLKEKLENGVDTEIVFVTGSLYFISEVRYFIKNHLKNS